LQGVFIFVDLSLTSTIYLRPQSNKKAVALCEVVNETLTTATALNYSLFQIYEKARRFKHITTFAPSYGSCAGGGVGVVLPPGYVLGRQNKKARRNGGRRADYLITAG